MIRIILISLLSLLSLSAFAQEQTERKPFFTDGKSWLFWQHWTVAKSQYFLLTVVGDTVVEGKDAKILLRDNLYTGLSNKPRTSKEVYLEEDGRIYVYYQKNDNSESDGKFLPLFDFNVKKGDKVNDRLVVEDVKTWDDLSYGYPTKIIWFGYDEYWIEGVGTTSDNILICDNDGIRPTGGFGGKLLQCFENGRMLYDSEIKISFPSFGGVEAVTTLPDDGNVYDLNGHRVKSPQKGKIYVKESKKVVW